MRQPIQIDGLGGAKFIEFRLENLKGRVKVNEFVLFNVELAHKIAEGFSQMSNPRLSKDDVIALNNIHQTIKDKTKDLPEREKFALQYWLATLFHNYLSHYDLLQEGFGCLEAGASLLKIRYHSMVELCRLQEKPEFKEYEQIQFRRAFRDWRNFCTHPQNHFLFQKERGLNPLETEVKAIIYGDEKCKKKPISFFLDNKEGRQRLDSLIATWFVRDRYDWFTAVKLVCHQAKSLQRVGFLVFVLLFGLSALVVGITDHPNGWQAWFLLIIYLFLFLLTICSLLRPPVMAILLPRFWAATIVGYLPIFITDDVWKLASNPHWWGAKWWGIIVLNIAAGFLSFFYLRWEIGNRLERTPNLEGRVVSCRAAWLTLLGWIIAVVLGLVLFHIAGDPMANAVWKPHEKPDLISISALGGEVYLTLLFQFAPFALLIGVILQIFWEDKPVTETL